MSDDFAAAIASAQEELGVAADPAPDNPATEPEPEPEPAEDGAAAGSPKSDEPAPTPTPTVDEEDIDFINPTAEDLAAIEASPELKRVYKSMQRGLTKKSTELASKRKEAESAQQVVEWIRSDPEGAIRTIAAAAKVQIGEAPASKPPTAEGVADTLEAKWAKTVGDEAAALLRPLFEETAKAIVEQTVGPRLNLAMKSAEASQAKALESNIASSIETFGATVTKRGEEWDDEIQADMAKIIDTVEPSKGTSINDFISYVYDTAITRRMRTKQARSTRDRLRRAREESEPTTSTRPTPKGDDKITVEMSDKDAVAIAVKQARRQLNQ